MNDLIPQTRTEGEALIKERETADYLSRRFG